MVSLRQHGAGEKTICAMQPSRKDTFVAHSACRCSSDALVKLLGWFALTSAQTEVPLYYRNDCRH